MTSILFHNGFIHSSSDPFAQALYVDDGVIAWIGDDDTAQSYAKRADNVIDLDGALIAPGFVDTHVHLLETALEDEAADVSPAAGGTSRANVLELIRAADGAHIVENQGGSTTPEVLCATGYDDSAWEGEPLTRADLDTQFPGRPVYVPRADLHSAIVSTALLDACGFGPEILDDRGRVSGPEHTPIRNYIRDLSADRRTALYRNVLTKAARRGVVSVHECAAPGIDTPSGLAQLIEMTHQPTSALPLVVGYLGELATTVEDVRRYQELVPGLSGLAGDLSIDGSFGSHSAALREPYTDDPSTSGTLHFTDDQIEQHLAACSEAGVTAGFHVIGDRALDQVLDAAERLVDKDPSMLSKMRRCGHRLEHAEIADEVARERIVKLGFMVSVQPAFDAFWGQKGGMYEQRLGAQRLRGTSPIRSYARDGIPMGFGSDAPVTPIDPWGAITAAVFHNNEEQRISARAAFRAHTRGGWRLSGEQNPLVGEIKVGAPAHLAIWQAHELGVQAENAGRSSWSTDGRSGSPLLPIVTPEGEQPVCLATLRSGVFIHRAEQF